MSFRRIAVRLSLAVVASTALVYGLAQATPAHAAGLYYVRGYRVEGTWLCYGWADGAYHCTEHWYRSASGLYVSLNPSWVPSQSSGTPPPPISPPTGCSGIHWEPGGIPGDSCRASQAAPAIIGLWKIPPAPYDRVYYVNPRLYPYRGGWPTCIWWARETSIDFGLGRGTRGYVPRVGAAIVYAPGVLGASSGGHYGHVIAVYSDGWILSSEMNFYWRGGGAGRVVFRFIPPHVAGVSFIY